MSDVKIALLEDRNIVAVTGEDAGKFLQGLITNDVDLLATRPAIFAALLSPQGKVLFDFFVVRPGVEFLLDVARDQADALVKRLSIYKLRAKVKIDIRPAISILADPLLLGIPDPRSVKMWRRLMAAGRDDEASVDPAEFHAHRIALGIPEGGKDFAWGEVFPHEANMDVLNGVSFTKGCYVGQEIVSRMEHRGTARRRIVRVQGAAPLPPAGTDVKAGDVTIGAMGSSAGAIGLAMLRLDRVAEFMSQGIPLTAADVTLTPDASDLARLSPRSEASAP